MTNARGGAQACRYLLLRLDEAQRRVMARGDAHGDGPRAERVVADKAITNETFGRFRWKRMTAAALVGDETYLASRTNSEARGALRGVELGERRGSGSTRQTAMHVLLIRANGDESGDDR